MKDFSIFLTPVSEKNQEEFAQNTKSLGSKVVFYNGDEINKKYKVAFLGVKESRGTEVVSVKDSPDAVRNQLYKLFPGTQVSCIDLGNIEQGESQADTFFALAEVLSQLIKKNIIPVVIGGSQELTLGMYKAFEKLELIINLTTIDRKIDFQAVNETTTDSYLKDILLAKPNYLFNYANLGSQSYYLNPDNVQMMHKLFFETKRLGELQSNMELAEPILRNSNLVSFDLNSIRQSEVPGTSFASPNGFFGNEACQIARYAGISDKLNAIGFFEMTPEYDIHNQTAQLVAQMIWYFLDGVAHRNNESPISNSKYYTNYKVVISNTEEELIFIKSQKSGRWWMKIPYPPSKKRKFERHHLVPCSYHDYEIALQDEMPDLWINTYNRIHS
ncbi:MAG: formimidoylglutamase [Flavobacteriales bacterium]